MFDTYLINKIKSANYPIAFTGSTVSELSGFPSLDTKIHGYKIKDALTIDFFNNNPFIFYKIFKYLLEFQNVYPNYIHKTLSNLNVNIITENFDGLHQKAGSHNVLELNNNLEYLSCQKCNYKISSKIALLNFNFPNDLSSYIVCPHCQTLLKPTLILLGETINNFNIALNQVYKSDLLLIIGNKLNYSPANSIFTKAKYSNNNILIL